MISLMGSALAIATLHDFPRMNMTPRHRRSASSARRPPESGTPDDRSYPFPQIGRDKSAPWQWTRSRASGSTATRARRHVLHRHPPLGDSSCAPLHLQVDEGRLRALVAVNSFAP